MDDVDGGRYFAQVRGLLQDQYCEKSAVLTWLLPTIYSPPPSEKFDPATYIIGKYFWLILSYSALHNFYFFFINFLNTYEALCWNSHDYVLISAAYISSSMKILSLHHSLSCRKFVARFMFFFHLF